MDYMFGYCCLLDITIRGKEERVMRKSFDTFTPVGRWIATAEEIPDASDIRIRLCVNGVEKQAATTRGLIVDIPNMIAVGSSAATLYPGDLIATGTPEGVGPNRPADRIDIEIEHVGAMTIAVVAGTRHERPVRPAL